MHNAPPLKSRRRFAHLFISTILAASALPASAATPTSAPTTTNAQHVFYPIPYVSPTAEQITQVLDRLHARLEAGTGARIIDNKTREPIADLSKPNPDA